MAKRRASVRTRQSSGVESAPPSDGAAPQRNTVAAADFFAALRRTLDALQRQLSSASNPFVDFVVKEFNVDAALQLHVNQLNVLELTLADDTTSPEAVSRLSLTFSAVAKAGAVAAPENLARADETALSDITWLPPKLVERLAQCQIKTAAEFLGLVADARLAAQVIALLQVDRVELGRWADQIRLLELPQMTIHLVRILSEMGLSSVLQVSKLTNRQIVELARRAPNQLNEPLLTQWRDLAKAMVRSAVSFGDSQS